MLSSRSRAIARTSLRILLSDPAPVVVMVVMPLLLTAFLKPAMAAQLRAAGFPGANGTEQLVPGMAVMFVFLGTSTICTLFYREHYWGTWQRLRASGAGALDILVGKAAPLYLSLLVQMLVVFGAGWAFFGFRVRGSVLALVLLAAAMVACVVAYGVMLVSLFRTLDQAMVIGNLGGMVMAGLGGALAPAASLPGWAQAVAHATPAYWGLRGISDVTLTGDSLRDVAGPLLAVLAFTAVFTVVAVAGFRPDDAKIGTT